MKLRGYYWCDICDNSANGPCCEHMHETRFVHVALTAERRFKVAGAEGKFRGPAPVDQERGAALFAQLFKQLNQQTQPHENHH